MTRSRHPWLTSGSSPSYASQESAQTWPATLKLLLDRKIPVLFTAYNHEAAEAEAQVLRAAAASLHPTLGPTRNPWGSIKVGISCGEWAARGWLQVKMPGAERHNMDWL
ncbi:hypothetical protein DFH06DRAFT_1151665 [Mycena polygramma]|nr:hypothetical protein DFH06DRAFT_1151665 [Mycena polygramma]